MWRFVSMIVVFALTLLGAACAEHGTITYYVQLVRGNDSEQPPQAGSRPVGAKLAETFHGAFKWKNYWEICRQKIEIKPGQSRRVRLSNGREVEIDLSRTGQRAVTAFQDGELMGQVVRPAGETMTLIGGRRDQGSIWFIAVRRDKPGEPAVATIAR